MCPIIVQTNENVQYNPQRKHLRCLSAFGLSREYLTVDKMSLVSVSHSASMTHTEEIVQC